jgi:hypothetical protein
MQNLIETIRTFPFLSFALIAVPFLGGIVGAFLGYDKSSLQPLQREPIPAARAPRAATPPRYRAPQ